MSVGLVLYKWPASKVDSEVSLLIHVKKATNRATFYDVT